MGRDRSAPAWPANAVELVAAQERLAGAHPTAWRPPERPLVTAGAWVCFPRGQTGAGARGDAAWAAAALMRGRRLLASATVVGEAGAPYEPGLLALREGALLEAAVRALSEPADVLLVGATGRDHPRRAGLALHLGAVLGQPVVGVTDRPLAATGAEPGPGRGDCADLRLDGELVARRVRTRAAARSVIVHPAWRTDLDSAVAVVLATSGRARTPEPLRLARRLAREARSRAR